MTNQTQVQHTQSWRVSPDPHDYQAMGDLFTGEDVHAFLVEGQGGDGLFDVGEVYYWPDFRAESIANARLIAAAPDLLAALEAAVLDFEAHELYVAGLDEYKAVIKRARGED
jgi:hypothetical protein